MHTYNTDKCTHPERLWTHIHTSKYLPTSHTPNGSWIQLTHMYTYNTDKCTQTMNTMNTHQHTYPQTTPLLTHCTQTYESHPRLWIQITNMHTNKCAYQNGLWIQLTKPQTMNSINTGTPTNVPTHKPHPQRGMNTLNTCTEHWHKWTILQATPKWIFDDHLPYRS